MPKKKPVPRIFSREFKLAAVERMLAGENVCALARELRVLRKSLYEWKDLWRQGGADALRPRGRPRRSPALPTTVDPAASTQEALAQAQRRIAELERQCGRQALELDFFAQALRHIGAPDTKSGSLPPSTPKRRKAD